MGLRRRCRRRILPINISGFVFLFSCCCSLNRHIILCVTVNALSTRIQHPPLSGINNNKLLSHAKSPSTSSPTQISTARRLSRPVDVIIRNETGQRVDQSPALPFTLGGNAAENDVFDTNSVVLDGPGSSPSRKPFTQRIRVDSGARVLLFCETKDERVAYLAWNDRSGRELFGSVARFSDGLLQNELRLILRAANAAFYPNTHEQDYICRAMDQHFNVLGLAVVQYHVVVVVTGTQPKKAKNEKHFSSTTKLPPTIASNRPTPITTTVRPKPSKTDGYMLPAPTTPQRDFVNDAAVIRQSWRPPVSTSSSVAIVANNNRLTNSNGVMGAPLPYHQHFISSDDSNNANVLHSYAHEPPLLPSSPPHYFIEAESAAHDLIAAPPPHRNGFGKVPQFYHEHASEAGHRTTPPRVLPDLHHSPFGPQLQQHENLGGGAFFNAQQNTFSPPRFVQPPGVLLLAPTTPPPQIIIEPSSLPPLRIPVSAAPATANDDAAAVVVVTSTPVTNFFIPTMASSSNNNNFYTTTTFTATTGSSASRVKVKIVEGNATVMINHDVTLNCYATVTGKGSAPAIITWWLSNALIRNNNNSTLAAFETTSDIIVNGASNATVITRGRLKFKAAQTHHDKKIWCRAISALVQSPTMSADESRKLAAETAVVLNVVYTPLVQAGNISIILTKENANVSLPCYMRGNPPVDVIRWYKNSRLIVEEELGLLGTVNDGENGESVQPTTVAATAIRQALFNPTTTPATMLVNDDVVTSPTVLSNINSNNNNKYQVAWLEMSHLQRDDIGSYACQAKNALGWGPKSEPLELVIHHKPGAAKPYEHATLDAAPGETVTLKCDVTDAGNPPSHVFVWRKDGKFVGRGSTFTIKNVGAWDFGAYSCAAFNGAGEGKAANIKLKPKDEATLLSDAPLDASSPSTITSRLFSQTAESAVVLIAAGVLALVGVIILVGFLFWCICFSRRWCCCSCTTTSSRNKSRSYAANNENYNTCCYPAGDDNTNQNGNTPTPHANAAAPPVTQSQSNSTSPSKLSDTEDSISKSINHHGLLPWTYHPHMLPRAHLAPAAGAGVDRHFTDGSRDSSPNGGAMFRRASKNVHHLQRRQTLAQNNNEQHVHDIVDLNGGRSRRNYEKRHYPPHNSNNNSRQKRKSFSSRTVATKTTTAVKGIQLTAATTESTLASAYSSPRSLTNYQPCWLVNANKSPTTARSVTRFDDIASSNPNGALQRHQFGGSGTNPWDWKSYRY